MKRLATLLARLLVLAVGLPLLAVGIILIPLPGPGILVCVVGLLVLSLGFQWPRPYLRKAWNVIVRIYREAKRRSDDIADKGK
jgi:uncharacterized protein (TIGR02611 family)